MFFLCTSFQEPSQCAFCGSSVQEIGKTKACPCTLLERTPSCVHLFQDMKGDHLIASVVILSSFLSFSVTDSIKPAFGYFYFSKTKIIYTVVEK